MSFPLMLAVAFILKFPDMKVITSLKLMSMTLRVMNQEILK